MNPQNPSHADRLLEQLRIFNEAAQDLQRQWSLTEDDGNHPIVMSNKYPFDESFDEITGAISEWYQAAANYQSIENTDLRNRKTYTATQRDSFANQGDVTRNGVVFDWNLVSISGASFHLIRESHHTDEDIKIAADHLRATRDVVSLSIARLEHSTDDNSNEMTFVHTECSQCGTLYKFPATRDQFKRYFAPNRAELVQDIFPEIPDPARAVLSQGHVCVRCLPQLEDITHILAPYII